MGAGTKRPSEERTDQRKQRLTKQSINPEPSKLDKKMINMFQLKEICSQKKCQNLEFSRAFWQFSPLKLRSGI